MTGPRLAGIAVYGVAAWVAAVALIKALIDLLGGLL